MKKLLAGSLFIFLFGVCLYFFLLNSSTEVSVRFFPDLATPELPLGMVILLTFFAGFISGLLFYPLTFVIKRIT
jgi:uncharacterized integral membrane protein